MTAKKKTQRGSKDRRGPARADDHVDLDLVAIAEGYDRAARCLASLYDGSANIPAWLSDLILHGLEAASKKTGMENWTDSEKGFNLRGLADLLAVSGTPEYRLEFEQKKDLPELISAVLRHPDTPANLYNAVDAAVAEWLLPEDTDPTYIRLALSNLAAVQKEIAEDEEGAR